MEPLSYCQISMDRASERMRNKQQFMCATLSCLSYSLKYVRCLTILTLTLLEWASVSFAFITYFYYYNYDWQFGMDKSRNCTQHEADANKSLFDITSCRFSFEAHKLKRIYDSVFDISNDDHKYDIVLTA